MLLGEVEGLQAHQVRADEEVDLARDVAPGRHRRLEPAKSLWVAPQEGADREEERALQEGDGDPETPIIPYHTIL